METITKDKVRHKKFTREEDKILKKLVAVHGSSNWIKIASLMEDRNSRQCRERWLNYLSPKLNKSEWTEEEDEFLLEMIQHTGKRWVKIASFFPGRTDQMLKNRYNQLSRESEIPKPITSRISTRRRKSPCITNDSDLMFHNQYTSQSKDKENDIQIEESSQNYDDDFIFDIFDGWKTIEDQFEHYLDNTFY